MPKHIAHSNKLLVVMSDIEMGGGGAEDDFPHAEFLADLFSSYNHPRYKDLYVHLIFNGDTFDLLKTNYNGAYPHLINEPIAKFKFDKLAACHQPFFSALKEFLAYDQEKRRVQFIVGNHDTEILFPAVQQTIKDLCGSQDQVLFPGFYLTIGDVHIEHGSQRDPMFYMPDERPFVIHKGDSYINLPWSTVCLLNVIMPMQKDFYHLDRMKPKKVLLEILPEIKELMQAKLWRYWTNDYLKDYMKSSDPLKKVSWGMIKEVVRRTTNFNPEIEMDRYFQRKMYDSERIRLFLVGHQHEACVWSYGNRKVIQTGCFRNEFMLENAGKSISPIPKSFAEVYMYNSQLVSSRLLEVFCPEQTQYTPPLPHTFLPKIKEYLGSMDDRINAKLAIERQEKKEHLL